MKKIVTSIATLFIASLAAGCSAPSAESSPSPSELPSDPVAQMELAFIGNPSQREIRAALERATEATGQSQTNVTYEKIGNALVTLRKERGIDEMKVLECVPTQKGILPSGTDPDEVFVLWAAACNTEFEMGDRK